MHYSIKSWRCLSLVYVAVSLLLMTACSGRSPSVAGSNEKKAEYEAFDPSNFSEGSANIDNPWFPLKPGTRFVSDGTTVDDEGKQQPRKLVFTVTDLTKVINGVKTRVCWDQDYVAGKLEEMEIVFFAQDKDGTVWHLGEYPEEYQDEKLKKTPCWIHGIKDGKAGIMMQANPKVGDNYSQGWAPSVPWTDRAEVLRMGEKTTVKAGSYEDVLVIRESDKEEPKGKQLKFYARGIGVVRVGFQGDQSDKETLELVKVEQLNAEELAKARDEVLKMEQRAYKNSKNVYGQTEPIPSGTSPVKTDARKDERKP